jgi:hypothetical protein
VAIWFYNPNQKGNSMIPVDQMVHHPASEKLVAILCNKTQNSNPLFFRVLVGYYFSLVASMMRATIITHDRGDIPVNMYALNLGTSGSGKGFSTNIIENSVINRFRTRYLEETFPLLAEINLPKLALKRANRKATDPDEELVRVQKEFDSLGSLVFSFDSGTPAAVKQMRHKLLMADTGSVNLQIDEIGSNLLANTDVLTTFLELYDVGRIKSKLVKNTSENIRSEEIVGQTPTNMMLFGTPAKLLNGGKQEEELYSMLETGYGRRCFFGYSRATNKMSDLTPEQVYTMLTNQDADAYLDKLSGTLENLADIINVNKKLVMTKQTSLVLITYRLKCEKEADLLPEHEEIKKAEISHRYFKALKLAGAYAFVDDSTELTTTHLYHAIKLAEESGDAFDNLLTRDRNYVKLAKYIATCRRDCTQADLVEDLPFYRGAAGQKSEMLSLAIAYGYKNNIIIKKSFSDGIEFLRGETLQETDLSKMVLAYSNDITTDYRNEYAPFDQLHKLTQAPGMHWTAHHLNGGYRNEENAIAGFNLVVIDVDGGVSLSTVKLLLKNYKYLIYTTKRHTDVENRFRVILPMNYTLEMDAKDYKEFMSNIYEWLPFECDTATNQRARKWMSHDGSYVYNPDDSAMSLDCLPFIPKTSKNEERKALLQDQQSMDNLERWVINNIGDGNRNNMLLRYAMILVDAGFDMEKIKSRVISLNDKIADKLDEMEILSTIMVSVMKAIAKKLP